MAINRELLRIINVCIFIHFVDRFRLDTNGQICIGNLGMVKQPTIRNIVITNKLVVIEEYC